MKSDIEEIRRQNFARLVAKHGGPQSLGKLLGVSRSYISQLETGTRPITEKTARKFEGLLGMERWMLDKPPGGGERVPFTGTDRALIADVVLAVEEELTKQNARLSPEKRARLVAEVYEHSVPSGQIDRDYLQRLISLLA